jgi:hypothetical protein
LACFEHRIITFSSHLTRPIFSGDMKIVDRHQFLRQRWKVRKCTSRTNLSGVPPNVKADLALSRDGWDIWQTRQLIVALLAGGSGASHGTQHSGMAQQIFPPGNATRTEDCQDRDGPQVGR